MTVNTVTSRIQELQAQLSMLVPSASSQAAAAGFAQALDSATASTSATASATAGTSTTGTAGGEAAVAEAKKYLGLPYIWGGTDPTKGMDCSGLVQVVYKHLGYDLPRLSADQARSGEKVNSMAEAKPGDLIAWNNSSRNSGADHIAIYAGNGKMIEAPRTGLDIRLVDVPSTPDYIRRIVPDNAPAAGTSAISGRATGVSGVPFSDLFNRAGAKYGVSPALLSAVAKQESGYNPHAQSGAGAQGLMQLMPGTAKGLGVTNSFDPAQAVDGAARMLRDLTNRFGRTDLALAAYNAGPGAVMKYNGIPPYGETQRYVRNVMSMVRGAA
jgi:cell wall-associated NlpC family hydrolase